jgi:hypothetical protein
MTRLDDLLAYDEDEARRRRRASGGRLAITIPALLVFGLALWLVMRWARISTPLPLVYGALFALYALRYVLGLVSAPKLPPTLRSAPIRPPGPSTGDDGVRQAVGRWNQRLEYAHDDARHMAHLIRPAFTELVDERLRLRHGISRTTDPARAYALIGPELGRFITETGPRQATPQEIATLVAQMEAL